MSNKSIKLCFLENDEEMLSDIRYMFGEDIEINKEYSVLGIDTLVTVGIPLVALTVQVIDFILNHCSKSEKENNMKKNSNESNSRKINAKKKKKDEKRERREIEFDGHRISLVNYTYEEAKDILLALVRGE